MKCDWGEFHPLMHWIGSRECFGWYGGPWRHAQLKWQFHISTAIRAKTRCRLGFHTPVDVYVQSITIEGIGEFAPDYVECADCGVSL